MYVDDILFIAPEEVVKSAAEEIQRHWTTSPLEVVSHGSTMKFCGVEIEGINSGFRLHQESYARELLNRHQVMEKTPCIKMLDEPEAQEAPNPVSVRNAQILAGELLWLSGRTRPDLAMAVSKMSRWVTRAPEWACQFGNEILKYLNQTASLGLVYEGVKAYDDDTEIEREKPRHQGTVEILTDASFAPSGDHSVSGLVIMWAGCPIQWHTQRQGLVALSTAEAELVAMVDSLQAGRAARSFIELIQGTTELEMHGDNRAALVLATGQGGGWRTRHLRIRSSALSEAIATKEVKLFHRRGTKLYADALTKILPAFPLSQFRTGMGMKGDVVEVPPISIKRVNVLGVDPRDVLESVLKPVCLLTSAITCLPGASGSATNGGESHGDGSSGDWSWLVLVLSILAIWEVVKTYGMSVIKSVFGESHEMKVDLISPEASVPVRSTPDAAGFDISTVEDFTINPGEHRLVPTGLRLQLPRGTYGRLASRSGLAVKQGIEVGAGVVDPDFRGEVKVLLINRGHRTVSFQKGDRIAQLVVEKIAHVKVSVKEDLSTTSRGSDGFGSSGIDVSGLRQGLTRNDEAVSQLNSAAGSRSAEDALPSIRSMSLESCDEASENGVSLRFKMNHHLGQWEGSPGQTMDGLLRTFSRAFLDTLFPSGIRDCVTHDPVGMQNSAQKISIAPNFSITLVTHANLRKKIFDYDDVSTWRSIRTTVAWMEDGNVRILVKERAGRRESFLDQNWRGYSLFYRRA